MLSSFKDLPQNIRDHLQDEEVLNAEEEVAHEFNLSEEQGDYLANVVKKIALKSSPISDMPKLIVELMKVDIATAQRISDRIIGSHFSNFMDFYMNTTDQTAPSTPPQPASPQPVASAPTPPSPTPPVAPTPSPSPAVDTSVAPPQTVSTPPPVDSLAHDLAKGLPQVANATPKQEYGVDAIIASLTTGLNDEVLKKRLYTIIDSRIREVRTPDQFKEILARPVKVGGLGFGPTQIPPICEKVEAEVARIHASVKIERPKDNVLITQVRVPQSTKQATPLPSMPITPDIQVAPPNTPMSTIVVMPQTPAPKMPPAPVSSVPHEPMPPMPTALPQVNRISQEPVQGAQNRQVMQDVRKEPAVPLNLTDEIAIIDMNEFRRVGGNTAERIARLKDKVDALAKESYAKKIMAIEAWRKSPLYGAYVELGSASLDAGSVEKAIAGYTSANKPCLAQDEFEAITDFNQSLNL